MSREESATVKLAKKTLREQLVHPQLDEEVIQGAAQVQDLRELNVLPWLEGQGAWESLAISAGNEPAPHHLILGMSSSNAARREVNLMATPFESPQRLKRHLEKGR